MEKTNKTLIIENIAISIAKNFLIINIIIWIYLIFAKPKLILSITYFLITILAVVIHILVIKSCNTKFKVLNVNNFDNIHNILDNPVKNNYAPLIISNIIFLVKIFWFQVRIFLIGSWSLSNILLHSNYDGFIDHSSYLTANIFINWIVLISLLVAFGYFNFNFNFSNIRLAKCLLPSIDVISNNQHTSNYFKTLLYNHLLGIETYIRIISFIIVMTVLLVSLFENVAVTFNLISLLSHPSITSFVIILVYANCRNHINKLIDHLIKKHSMNFINTFTIVFLIIASAIFIINQLCLSKLDFLSILNQKNLTAKSYLLSRLLQDVPFNQDRINILAVGLNIILVFSAVGDVFLKHLSNCSVIKVYLFSCIFPVILSILSCKSNFLFILHKLLITDFANYLMLLLLISIFIFNYQELHHIFCMFAVKPHKAIKNKNNIKNNTFLKIKFNYSFFVKFILIVGVIFLSAYYVFSWIVIEQLAGLASLLLLPVIIMLVISVLFRINNNLIKMNSIS